MYGEVVEGISDRDFEHALEQLKENRGVKNDAELTADDLKELVATFLKIYKDAKGEEFPQEPRTQLLRSTEAVFKSWNNPRVVSSLSPRSRIVSIIPGIEIAAPERTETSSGLEGSPKPAPVACSSRPMCSSISSSRPSGSCPPDAM